MSLCICICEREAEKANISLTRSHHKSSSSAFVSDTKSSFVLLNSVWTEIGCIPGLYLVVCGRRAKLNLRKHCPSALVVRGRAELTTTQWQVLTAFSLVVVFQSCG